MSNKKTSDKSVIEIFLHGHDVRINEYFSKGMIEKVLKHAEKEYGITFKKKCQSMCG